MTLSKQLLLLLSALFLLIFTVNYVIGIKNIQSQLQTESQAHAQHTANLLSLSLSPYILKESDPILKTMIDPVFDIGYYKEIKLNNDKGKTLVKFVNNKFSAEIPGWFIRLLPLEATSAESDISSGWTFGGTIYVTINHAPAYLKLYRQAKSAFYYSLSSFLLSVCLLIFILRFTLKPLKNINGLAMRISESQFETITNIPWTTEFRNIAYSINIMSSKLNGVMANLNDKLAVLGHKLQLNSLTGLYNKNTFNSDLKQLYLENTEAYLFLIKTDSLTILVKEHDCGTIDAFLQDCAAQLKLTAQNFSSETIAYHFYGAEFAVLARNIELSQARKLAKALSMTLSELGHIHHRADIGHIGVVSIDLLGSPENMLHAAQEAYEQAVIIGPNSYYIRTGADRAKDIAEWKSLVFDVVERNSYKIQFTGPIMHIANNRILMEEAFLQAFDKQGASLPVGIFVAIAEKYEKIISLDQGVIEKVIDQLNGASSSLNIAVNLSTRTIKNSDFRSWFSNQLKQNAFIVPQLIISFSAYAVSKDFNAYHEFIKFLHASGVRIILKRFDSQSMSVNMLKIIKPDFIRLSYELISELQGNIEKISFLQTVKEVSDLLDIPILVEKTLSDTDFDIIAKIGLATPGQSRYLA
jgi:EAL domain-containing protein (putative c-di-GMP-specific phosphodiesterase class I)/GGDEF domain-containing protein